MITFRRHSVHLGTSVPPQRCSDDQHESHAALRRAHVLRSLIFTSAMLDLYRLSSTLVDTQPWMCFPQVNFRGGNSPPAAPVVPLTPSKLQLAVMLLQPQHTYCSVSLALASYSQGVCVCVCVCVYVCGPKLPKFWTSREIAPNTFL